MNIPLKCMETLSQLILINNILIYLGSFEKQCDIPVCLLNSDLFYLIFSCWDNGVLQFVSEQVGPSGQVDESCGVV